ncbi:MAG: hypothetical protein ACP5I1_07655 [Candidatus Hinthialibacter sp.]
MKKLFVIIAAGVILLSPAYVESAPPPHRWVYVSKSLHRDRDLDDIQAILQTASKHGINGMALSAGFDRLDLQPAHYFERLERVKILCRESGVELIPMIFSVGYGGSVLGHDKNLAAGLLVQGARYRVEKGKVSFLPDPQAKIENGDLERYEGNNIAGYQFHDQPGTISFVDTKIRAQGRASLRMENFASNPHGHGRIMQEVAVTPHRCYRLTFQVKTENLQPEGSLRFMALADERSLAPIDLSIPSTTDWRTVSVGFNSLDYNQVKIYIGVWGGKSGQFWLDDIRLEEVSLLNVLRRPGAPVTVRHEQTGAVYEEGVDYKPIEDPKLNFRFDHELPSIQLLPDSRIPENGFLRVDYYHGMSINRGQVSVCMSEPKLYEIWDEQIQLIKKHLDPDYYFLSMDEIRAGGACQACQTRNLSMAEILGNCITRQCGLIKKHDPGSQILIWSDMLYPHHNAHDDYYLVTGDFSGAWNYIPKDLIIACWYYDKREESLPHFDRLGFPVLAAAYYEDDTLENPRGWLASLKKIKKPFGVMYTTWQNKYEDLAEFGDLASQ